MEVIKVYYQKDEDNNIVYVYYNYNSRPIFNEVIPEDFTNRLPSKPENLSIEESNLFDAYWNNYDYSKILNDYESRKKLFDDSIFEVSIDDYNEVWDECKRQPFDKDRVTRYKIIDGIIMQKENVYNI